MADRAGASVRRSRQWSALRSAAFLVRFPSRSPDFRNRGNSSSSSRSVCLILTRRASGGSKSRTPIIRRKRGEATFSIGRGPGSDSPQIPIAIVKMRRTLRGDTLREWRTRLLGKASPLKPTRPCRNLVAKSDAEESVLFQCVISLRQS